MKYPNKRRAKPLKAKELDKKFDKGEDISKYLDLSRASRPGRDQRRENVGKRGQVLRYNRIGE